MHNPDIFDTLTEGYFKVDMNDGISLLNRSGAKILGYSDKSELNGKHASEVFFKRTEDFEKLKNNLIQKQSTTGFLTFLRHKSKSDISVKVDAYIIYDTEQNQAGIEGIFRDIGENDVSRESNEMLQSIIDNTTAIISLKDISGKYKTVNRQFEKIFGKKREDIVGKTDHEIFPEEISQPFRDNDLKVLEARIPLELEEVIPHRDGLHTYLSIKFPLFDQQSSPHGICGISTDITWRKRTEEILRKEQEKQKKYLDVAGVMFVVLNPDQKVTLINKKGCEILGYESHEIIGKNWFDCFLPDDSREMTKKVFTALIEGNIENVEYFENHVLTKEGAAKIIYWHNAILKNDDGKIIGTLSSGEDITENKMAKKELARREAELRNFSRELKGFLNIITNDIQRPIESIIVSGETQCRDYMRNNKIDVTESLEYVRDAVSHLKTAATDLMKNVSLKHLMEKIAL